MRRKRAQDERRMEALKMARIAVQGSVVRVAAALEAERRPLRQPLPHAAMAIGTADRAQ
jgi:hypothetical protein